VSLLIRRLRKADRSSWAHMRGQLWGDHSLDEHLAEIDAMLRSRKFFAYVALSADEPVGFAEVGYRDYANGCSGRPVPFLEGIWVAPKHRRQGVGRSLVGRISTDLVKAGFAELGSDADIKNQRSHRAHAHWGFAETERVVYFRKSLTP
jgi:aminoglycoside 6'-N-acetyltransferase I